MTGKPEILMVTEHACVRVLKEAHVLKKLGYNVHLVFGGPILGPLTANGADACQMFRSVTYFKTKTQLSDFLLVRRFDVYHVHVEPYWLVSFVRHTLPEAKIICDMKDSMYWRAPGTFRDEDTAVSSADAFLVPSHVCGEELAGRTSQDIEYLPSAVPLDWYVDPSCARGGIANQGGHTLPDDMYDWRDYTDIYCFLKQHFDVYAYSPQFGHNKITEHYMALDVRTANVEYFRLLQALGSHDWNLVGNDRGQVWQYALPNKFFDAIAAGVPVMVLGVPEVEKIVNDCDIGVICNSKNEMVDNYNLHEEKRNNLLRVRDILAMDHAISGLVDLYRRMS